MAAKTARRPRAAARPASARTTAAAPATMPFSRLNYRLLLGAIGLIVLGYAVLLVDNATSDNPVDSVMSLWIAPLLLISGYVGVAGAVLWGVPREAAPEPDPVVEPAA